MLVGAKMHRNQIAILPGGREGTLRYYLDGWKLYRAHSRKTDVIIDLECKNSSAGRCSYKVFVKGDPNADCAEYVEVGTHHHSQGRGEYPRDHFMFALENAAANNLDGTPLEDLYDTVKSQLGYAHYLINSKADAILSVNRKMLSTRGLVARPMPELIIPPRQSQSTHVEQQLEDEEVHVDTVDEDSLSNVPPACQPVQYENLDFKDRIATWRNYVAAQECDLLEQLAALDAQEAHLRVLAGPLPSNLPISDDVASPPAEAPPAQSQHSVLENRVADPHGEALVPRLCSRCKFQPACVLLVGCGHISMCGICAVAVQIGDMRCPACGRLGEYDAAGYLFFQVAL